VGDFTEIGGLVETANTGFRVGNALTSCRLLSSWGLLFPSRQVSLGSGIVSNSVGSSSISSVCLWLVLLGLLLLLDLILARDHQSLSSLDSQRNRWVRPRRGHRGWCRREHLQCWLRQRHHPRRRPRGRGRRGGLGRAPPLRWKIHPPRHPPRPLHPESCNYHQYSHSHICRKTYPTDRTAWATGPSRSICSEATRYLATNIRRSFQTSIISS
jgi:hypothetical protein